MLSGPGLHAIYDYVRDSKKNEPTWLSEQIKAGDPAAVIAAAGLKGQADIAKQALDLFASLWTEAGNLPEGHDVNGGIWAAASHRSCWPN